MVDEWLLQAIRLDVDLKPLFESRLCTQNLCDTDNAIEDIKQFQEFHPDDSTLTVKYTGSMADLRYSDTIYEEVFAEKLKQGKKVRGVSALGGAEELAREEGDSPIQYDIDFFFIRHARRDQIAY